MDEEAESMIQEWLLIDESEDGEEQQGSIPEMVRNVLPEEWNSETEDGDYLEDDMENDCSADSSDDEESEADQNSNYYYGKNRFKWSSIPPSRNVRAQSHNILRLPFVRPVATQNGTLDILESFQLIFDTEMMETVLLWTNKKLETLRNKYTSEHYTFRECNQIELKGFLSLLIYSAVFKSGHESVLSLFATDGTGRNIFRASMSMKRFLVLLIALWFDNFEDRATRKTEDPGCAITDFLEMFNKNSRKNYTVGANVTIDEMLIAFRGKCKFKMYIPSKPAKYGTKLQCLADSSTYYVYNTYLYTGKGSDGRTLPDEYKRKAVPTQAVLRLCEPLYNTNRNVTTDNWYSSIELYPELKKKGLTTVGTLKKNKVAIPKNFQANKTRPIGSSLFGFTKDCTLVSFVPKKNKAVILYSTMHHDDKVNPENNKPEIIEYYNSTKGGVDSVDQRCSVYSCSRRTPRRPLAVFLEYWI